MGIEALVGKSPARRGFNKMTTADHLKLAVKTAQSPLDFAFHLGYQQFVLPRWFRRLFARQSVHKAWLNGYHGWWIGKVGERSF